MKKNLSLLVVVLALMLVLCACGEKKEDTQNIAKYPVIEKVEETNGEENTEEYEEEFVEDYNEEEFYEEEDKVVDPTDVEKLIISLNDASFKINEKFEDVKTRLGAEAKPSQSYTPCGGSDDAHVTTHYYDGLEVEETAEGIVYHAKISGFDYPDSKATIAGIKLGDTPDTVRSTFGSTPDSDSEYTINYTFGTLALSFSLDFEGTGNVNYISIDDFALGGL